jgi:translation initiation factor IF-3
VLSGAVSCACVLGVEEHDNIVMLILTRWSYYYAVHWWSLFNFLISPQPFKDRKMILQVSLGIIYFIGMCLMHSRGFNTFLRRIDKVMPATCKPSLQYTVRFASSSRLFAYLSTKDVPLQEPAKDIPNINENICFPKVRVVLQNADSTESETLGVLLLADALREAKSRDLDLVLINENGNPPVCKLVDYGKFRYSKERRQREQQKKQSKSKNVIKEIKLSYKIDTHDLEFKQKATKTFLLAGDRVS